MAVIDPQTVRADHQPVSGLAGRPRQFVDGDALDAASVTALGGRRDDLEVNYVTDVLRQLFTVSVILADVLSNQ